MTESWDRPLAASWMLRVHDPAHASHGAPAGQECGNDPGGPVWRIIHRTSPAGHGELSRHAEGWSRWRSDSRTSLAAAVTPGCPTVLSMSWRVRAPGGRTPHRGGGCGAGPDRKSVGWGRAGE